MDEIQDLLRGASAFTTLRPEVLAALAEVTEIEHVDVGTILYTEGEPAGGLFVVAEGAVELVIGVGESSDRVFGTVRNGNVLGLLSLIDGGPRAATARVVENATVLSVGRHHLEQLRRQDPLLWAEIIDGLAAQIAEQTRIVVEQFRRTIEWSLEVSGCADLNLKRLLVDSVEVDVQLVNGTSVCGVILAAEASASGHDLILRSDGGQLHLIPYRSVVQIIVARSQSDAISAG